MHDYTDSGDFDRENRKKDADAAKKEAPPGEVRAQLRFKSGTVTPEVIERIVDDLAFKGITEEKMNFKSEQGAVTLTLTGISEKKLAPLKKALGDITHEMSDILIPVAAPAPLETPIVGDAPAQGTRSPVNTR